MELVHCFLFIEEGLAQWKGGEQLRVEEQLTVPVTRLDTFLDGLGVGQIEYLKVDAQGADLAAVRSAGKRLADIRKISMEVQITTLPLYSGATDAEAAVAFLREAGFELVSIEEQSFGQEENLTFVRSRDCADDPDGSRLARARMLAPAFRPLVPDPGWRFDRDWNSEEPDLAERRAIWQHFRTGNRLGPLEATWLHEIRLRLYLGNDLSRQLFVLGRFEPNRVAWLNQVLREGMCFVDAGANEGLYTMFAASRVGSNGTVWAFEPTRASSGGWKPITNLIVINRSDSSDRPLRPCGVRGIGIAEAEHSGQNRLGVFHDAIVELRRERVRAETFDEVARREGLSRLDVLKIDVEGEEYRLCEAPSRASGCMAPVSCLNVPSRCFKAVGQAPPNCTHCSATGGTNCMVSTWPPESRRHCARHGRA